ncbi:MAG: AAA family ATPase [Henriciella sp.]|uniref:chloramphenicol phosphotransferase CPT family protein n=1 Tax=Henriciella sp. TaxID=1968823 RepID=UPI003C71D933
MARVIILNGTTSAGKTSLAKAVQRLAEKPILRVSMDDFLEMMPPRYANHAEAFEFRTLSGNEGPEVEITAGPYGMALLEGMRASVAALADSGLDVLVDDVTLDASALDDYRRKLAGHDAHFVAVTCSLETAEAREVARGDRDIGQARWQYSRVHEGKTYDLEINTDEAGPEACARRLIDAFSL